MQELRGLLDMQNLGYCSNTPLDIQNKSAIGALSEDEFIVCNHLCTLPNRISMIFPVTNGYDWMVG